MTKAVVLVNPDRLLPNAHACYQYCLAVGYQIVGIVRSWEEAIGVNRADPAAEVSAEVVVVAEEADLPPDRTPRLEVVAYARPEIFFQAKAEHEAVQNGEPAPAPAPIRRGKRTRLIRRTSAE